MYSLCRGHWGDSKIAKVTAIASRQRWKGREGFCRPISTSGMITQPVGGALSNRERSLDDNIVNRFIAAVCGLVRKF